MCTAAELVYGTTLRLPGEFFAPSHTNIQSPVADSMYASRLKEAMRSLSAVPPGTHNFDGRTLATPSPTARMYLSGLMGFVNHFSNRTMVHSKFWKHYTINRNGHPTVISLDRLKAAHMEPPPTRTADTSHSPSFLTPPTAPPQRVTRSGRHVHWPQRLVYYA